MGLLFLNNGSFGVCSQDKRYAGPCIYHSVLRQARKIRAGHPMEGATRLMTRMKMALRDLLTSMVFAEFFGWFKNISVRYLCIQKFCDHPKNLVIYIYITIHIICILQHVQIYTVYIYICAHTHTFSTHSDHAGAITGGPDPTAYCRNLRECARSCSVHQVERREDDTPTSCGGVLSSSYLDKNVYIQYIYIYIYIFERCAGCNHLEQCWFQHRIYIYIWVCVRPVLIQGVSVPAIQIEVVQEDMEMLGYEFVPWIAKRF